MAIVHQFRDFLSTLALLAFIRGKQWIAQPYRKGYALSLEMDISQVTALIKVL